MEKQPDVAEKQADDAIKNTNLQQPAKPDRPFRLVSDDLSFDTVEALEELLVQAKSGELIGMVFAAMYKGKTKQFIVNATGEAYRNPTFSRGMVAALDDALAREVGRW